MSLDRLQAAYEAWKVSKHPISGVKECALRYRDLNVAEALDDAWPEIKQMQARITEIDRQSDENEQEKTA
jgi:hypothetical protein